MVKEHVENKMTENLDFLHRFYQSPTVSYDTVGEKIAKSLFPNRKLVQLTSDLKGEGKAGDVVLEKGSGKDKNLSGHEIEETEELLDDIFDVDREEYLSTERRKLTKRTWMSVFMLFVAIPIIALTGYYLVDSDTNAIGIWMQQVFGSRKYYFISLVIVICALVPFFMVFEGRKPQARELIVLATLAAIATAGRGAFFMIPHFKPMVAIVVISGISFGAESGFLVGAVTMIVSNFLFGQGPWTPWQMLTLGLIGFLSGILHRVGLLPVKRLSLCIYGFLVTIFIYGGIMNPASVVMSVYEITWESILAAYISGIPVDLVHASSTFIFLWVGAKPLIEKLQRIKVKYGLL